eukprot:GCRY01001801.1.p1 GENE.GCRY01001801.1~~GCRY01001801.1.p1  ORF type:complete len:1034 (+),score=309.33 GCRY01001801.1:1287-4388(+)
MSKSHNQLEEVPLEPLNTSVQKESEIIVSVNKSSLEGVIINGNEWNGEGFAHGVHHLQGLVDPKNIQHYHQMGSLEGIAKGLKTDIKTGLCASDLSPENKEKRISAYGMNVLPEKKPRSLFSLMWEALQDKTLIMLCIAAVVSLVIGVLDDPDEGWIEGTAILVAVCLVVVVGSLNDYSKEKQFRRLNAKKQDRLVTVIRHGDQIQVSIYDLLVGDVIIVDTGDILPADAVLISGHELRVDESTATGESLPIQKTHDIDPFFLSNTKVVEGYGTAIVINVGEHSFSGKIMTALQKDTEGTPLQNKLEDLAEVIGKLGLAAAVVIVLALIAKYFIKTAVDEDDVDGADIAEHVVEAFLTGIVIVVVAVPEGLPLAVTMALAYSMSKMLKDQNLVRRLEACETMGGATTICSDKTGTLTQNLMSVVAGSIACNFHGLDGKGTVQDGVDRILTYPKHVQHLLTEGACINSKAYEVVEENGKKSYVGSQTEGALLTLCTKLGVDYKVVREKLEIVKLLAFSSARKRMSTIVKLDTEEGTKYRVYCKGASEIILDRCSHYLNQHGETVALNPQKRTEFKGQITSMASKALRTLCLAYSDYGAEMDWNDSDTLENKLVCIGIVGILDPVRPEVPEAVRMCQKAGVFVRMVTGDNLITAINIAKQCNIYQEGPHSLALEGPEFRRMTKEDHERIIPKLQVLARSSPLDKELLVQRLKDMGEIVAVTGDGTNDAPALKNAHVGFAMGIAGTEVAKESSDVILMDDNFASIVKAIMWGRNVFDSIRKFLQFQLTINVVAVLLAFVGSLTDSDGESPLKPVQLLWINLIMDTFAALALATESPTMKLLDRPPNDPEGALISRTMWRNVIGQGVFQTIVCFAILFGGHKVFHIGFRSDEHLTVFYNSFVMLQLFNEINSRKLGNEINIFERILHAPIFLGVVIGTLIVQVLLIEFGGTAFSTVPLDAGEWIFCIIVGLCSIPIGFVIRLIPISDKIPPPRTLIDTAPKPMTFRDAALRVQTQMRVVNAFRRHHRDVASESFSSI